MTSALGLLKFRAPLDRLDRANVINPSVTVGDGTALPIDSITLAFGWPTPLVSPPQLRPMFPGAMRFIARDFNQVPSLDKVEANTTNGVINEMYLKELQLTGTIVVRLQSQAQVEEMKRIGTIGAIGEAPRIAIYGPVKLSERFLRDAILDGLSGLKAGSFNKNGVKVSPGDTEWQPLALAYFLGGTYEPLLRAQEALDEDDAQRLPMPELITEQLPATGTTFRLNITLGWLRDPAHRPISPTDPQLESIPVATFLRHIGKEGIREAIDLDELLVELFQNETSSKPWEDRLVASLQALGFGDLDGLMPPEAVLREFQISAAWPVVATAKSVIITEEQLARRDFRDLVAVANGAVYKGSVSGRANRETRRLIGEWSRMGLRSPVMIAAFDGLDDQTLKVPQGKEAAYLDLWRRKETEDTGLRMFAADFARLQPGSALDETDLELIGYYGPYTVGNTGGPASLKPKPNRRVPYAEFRPGRVGLNEQQLAAAQQGNPLYATASTFRVIRAVSEIECLGNLDQINAIDDAGISYGPCHWSLAMAKKDASVKTELGGLAAYFHFLEQQANTPGVDVFAPQGLRPFLKSSKDIESAAQHNSNGAYVWRMGLKDDRGGSRGMTEDDVLETIPSWRNFYRWTALGRRNQVIGPATWAMALRRLHQLMNVSFPKEKLTAFHKAEMASPTIGSIFTSEVAVAFLLRWHVKKPNTIVTTKDVGDKLVVTSDTHIVAVYSSVAKKVDPKDRDGWQKALVKAIEVEAATVDGNFAKDFKEMVEQPWWNIPALSRGHEIDRALTTLDERHGSFVLLEPYSVS